MRSPGMIRDNVSSITNRDANRHGSAMEVRAPDPSVFKVTAVTEKPSVNIKSLLKPPERALGLT